MHPRVKWLSSNVLRVSSADLSVTLSYTPNSGTAVAFLWEADRTGNSTPPPRTMKLTRGLILAAAMFSIATASAQGQTQVKLTGAGNTVKFGVYVGPYRGQLGSAPGAATVDIFCVDYLNHSRIGQTWTVNKTNLGFGNTNLSSTRFGGMSDALGRYQQAAWLTTQFAATPATQWGDIHATIWHLMTPTSPSYTPSSTWLAAAQNFYLTNTNPKFYDQFQVLSDVGMGVRGSNGIRTGGVQEFIVVTPEPATILLLGTGLVGIMLVGYKRFS